MGPRGRGNLPTVSPQRFFCFRAVSCVGEGGSVPWFRVWKVWVRWPLAGLEASR